MSVSNNKNWRVFFDASGFTGLKALTVFEIVVMAGYSVQPLSYQERVILIPDRNQSQLCFDFDVGGSSLNEHSYLTKG